MTATLRDHLQQLQQERELLEQGGGAEAIRRQHEKSRLTARERITRLLDEGSPWHEIGVFAAWGMYEEWGGAVAAGAVCGLGRISGRWTMIIANDATVKAGAFFPMTAKKVIRNQRI
ncbi:MAG: carboxyl transferase domain-containing protein, partial [Terriglobales bacterium]